MSGRRFAVPAALRHVLAGLRGRRALLPGAIGLLLLALADPQLPLVRAQLESVVVLDITQSMDVADVQLEGRSVSRLALARAALHGALGRLPCGSRIGLGVFTEHRSVLLLAPLEVCSHLQELRGALARIDGRMAWSGNSEVAKGLNSALRLVRALPDVPSLVFVTDGHEAPPLNPRYRPPMDSTDRASGWLVGVGGLAPVPIPRSDPEGRPLGFWGAREVLQVEPYSQGRGGSVQGERMVEDPAGPAPPDLGATPGREHLSSLREPYLQRLAQETGLRYARLQAGAPLLALLRDQALAQPRRQPVPLRPLLVVLALALLALRHVGRVRLGG